MTADFQILMPSGKKVAMVGENNNAQPTCGCAHQKIEPSSKWPFVWVSIFFVGVALVFMGLLVRCGDKLEVYKDQVDTYQDQLDAYQVKLEGHQLLLERYEERIEDLETDLDRFMKSLMADEDLEYETHAGQQDSETEPEPIYDEEPSSEEDYLVPKSSHTQTPKEFKDESAEQERLVGVEESSQHFGTVLLTDKSGSPNEVKSRRKRQIPFPNVPTFGPDVERTGSGVPVVEESYRSSTGVTLKPRQLATTQSEGLHLYERLVERGGSGTPRIRHQGQQSRSTLLPHHQVSAAWSDPSESVPRSRIQLKSGDSSGFGTSSSSESRPSSSRRSQHYSRTSSSRPTASSNSNPFISGSSSVPSGTTHHRNSRVPSTGDYFYPSASGGGTTTATKTYSGSSSSNADCDDCGTRTRSRSRIQYPPLRTLTVGDGEGEVIARVLQTDQSTFDNRNTLRRDRDNTFANAALGDSDATASRQTYQGRYSNPAAQINPTSNSGITSHASTQSFSGRNNPRKFSSGRHSKPSLLQDDQDSGEVSIVQAEAWVEGPKPLAAHFVADVSNYTTAHRHYDGNGRLRNADGIFEAWRPAEWMTADAGSKNFDLGSNGELTLKKAGLYYVYAQIHYLDDHDINGFIVQVNKEPFLQCTTMTETYSSESKSNSCFTAGIQYFKAEDKIVIKDIETNRYSIFKPEKSFFGLMKVGAVP